MELVARDRRDLPAARRPAGRARRRGAVPAADGPAVPGFVDDGRARSSTGEFVIIERRRSCVDLVEEHLGVDL